MQTQATGALVESAARRLYDSECALHAARGTGVDEWIAAAADRLHAAVEAYLEAHAIADRAELARR